MIGLNNLERENMILENQALINHIIRKYFPRFTRDEDVFMEGVVALIKAVDSFDASKGYKFSSYAGKSIFNAIIRYSSSKSVPNLESLDSYIYEDGHTSLGETLASDLNVSSDYESKELNDILLECLSNLSDKERYVIECSFGLNNRRKESQRTIAYNLHVSQTYVSKVYIKTLVKLKRSLLKSYERDLVAVKSLIK